MAALLASRGDSGGNQPGQSWLYEQARIRGGGSSINGICANRGRLRLRRMGSEGRHRVELVQCAALLQEAGNRCRFWRATPRRRGAHADPAPSPRRLERVHTHQREIFADMGYAKQDDQNGPWVDGVYPTSINLDQHGRRAGTALAYLSPEVRRRPNLAILTDTLFEGLVIVDGRIDGGRLIRNNECVSIKARQVIISAGALQSPVILMKSGIGPGVHLAEHGIPVAVHRPGVGENFRNIPRPASLVICIRQRACLIVRGIISRRLSDTRPG